MIKSVATSHTRARSSTHTNMRIIRRCSQSMRHQVFLLVRLPSVVSYFVVPRTVADGDDDTLTMVVIGGRTHCPRLFAHSPPPLTAYTHPHSYTHPHPTLTHTVLSRIHSPQPCHPCPFCHGCLQVQLVILYAEAVLAPLQGFGDGLVYGLNKQVWLGGHAL